MIDEQLTEWEAVPLTDSRVEVALAELQSLILQHYPDAQFGVAQVGDMDGLWLTATMDFEDMDEVMDVIIDRLLEMQIEERLPVHVLPLRPPERIGKMTAEGKFGPRYAATLAPSS